MNQRWLLIIVSSLAIFSLAASGWLFYQNLQLQKQISQLQTQPSPSPAVVPGETWTQEGTANWKTYSNTKYNYSVKYPDELEASEDAKLAEQNYMNHLVFFNKYTSTPLKDRTMVNGRYLLYSISLGIPINNNNLSLDNWLAENSESLGKEERKKQLNELYNSAPKSIIVDQSKGYQWEYQYNIISLFEKNGTIYQVQSTVLDPLNTNLEDVVQNYNQILSTFKFTAQEMGHCSPSYAVETNTPELTASQNYASECLSQKNKDDCLSIDFYNKIANDFTSPDGMPDCLWSNQ